jgi:hypothetical protein
LGLGWDAKERGESFREIVTNKGMNFNVMVRIRRAHTSSAWLLDLEEDGNIVVGLGSLLGCYREGGSHFTMNSNVMVRTRSGGCPI